MLIVTISFIMNILAGFLAGWAAFSFTGNAPASLQLGVSIFVFLTALFVGQIAVKYLRKE